MTEAKGNASHSDWKGYVEISIQVPASFEEDISNFLIEKVEGGQSLVLEEIGDDIIIKLYAGSTCAAVPEVRKIKSFLDDSHAVPNDEIDSRIMIRTIEEIDWVEQYQKMFEPVEVGNIVVKSVWSTTEFPGKTVIKLEPKMAFGTGKHETTKLCISAIMNCVKPGDTMVDLGTGSGILAILAAKLGAVEVLGLDIDIAAVENARENAGINHLDDRITIRYGSMQKVKNKKYYDLMVSNLIRDGIIELFDNFERAVKTGGVMILSGILTDQIEEMNTFFERRGYKDFDITTLNEWVCYVIRT